MESPFNTSSQSNVPGVPPPPAEVKVRTMRTDLESMAKSGGGLPQFQNVAVAGIAIEAPTPQAAPAEGNVVPLSGPGSKSPIGLIAVIIVALIAIGAVAYFAYVELGHTNTGAPTTASSTMP